jgi:hypothetical protein
MVNGAKLYTRVAFLPARRNSADELVESGSCRYPVSQGKLAPITAAMDESVFEN